MSAYDGFIVSYGILVLIVLHEEHMSNVEFPSLMFTAELCGLAEELLNHAIVALVPVKLCLHHEYWDVIV